MPGDTTIPADEVLPLPPRAPAPRVIDGWTLGPELGRGGMGVVWRARAATGGEEVALKVVTPTGRFGPDEALRFMREAEVGLRLRHPGIVGVRAWGRQAGLIYAVLDLVLGETLRARIDRGGPLPERDAAALVAGLADAVEHAHREGVLHRDIKPQNVLLEQATGAARLADFGLAAWLDPDRSRLTATGTALGTPAYMSPEQARGESDLDARTDVYGLGATLYDALTGRPPFRASSHLALLELVQREEVEPPSTSRPGLDPALEALCLSCLAKERADRPGSAAELAFALRRWLASARSARIARPRPRVWVAALACGVAVAGASALPPRAARADLAEAERVAVVLDVPSRVARAIGLVTGGEDAAARVELDLAIAEAATAPALVARSRLRLRAGDVPGQLEDLDRAVALAPSDHDLRLHRGAARAEQGDFAGAGQDCARALSLRWTPRGWTFAAKLDLQRGRVPEALAWACLAIALGPGESEPYFLRAYARMSASPRDVAGAVTDLDAGLALQQSVDALVIRAVCKRDLGDLPGATADLERALVLAPDRPQTLCAQADTLLARWREDRSDETLALAERAAQRARALAPGDGKPWLIIAECEELRGQLDAADRAYVEARRLDPQLMRAWVRRALLLERRKDAAGALAELDEALEHVSGLAAQTVRRARDRIRSTLR